MKQVDFSVVLPAHNEAENLPCLVREIAAALSQHAFEVIVVDDGSDDDTEAVVESLASGGINVRRLAHPRPQGQSAAVWTGVTAARAPIVMTLDADGQNDPAFLPELSRPLTDPNVGLVAGQRSGRQAKWSTRVSSIIANKVRGALLRDRTPDTGCGAKAFRREAFMALPYFDGLHRFLPALFLGDGWEIRNVEIVDRPRAHGRSHYGIVDRLIRGTADMFGVWWLIRRRRRSPRRTAGEGT